MYLDLNLSWLPIFFALWTLIGWLLCYTVAVLTGKYCLRCGNLHLIILQVILIPFCP